MDLVAKWNSGSRKIPKDKTVSVYAVEKEKEFPRNAKVLDLGGGSGVDSIYFLQKGHDVVLVDISDYALSVADENAKNLGLNLKTNQIQLGKDSLLELNEKFDVVYSRLALHYFDEKTTTKLLKEINDMLVQGGKTFLTVKSTNDTDEMKFLTENSVKTDKNVFYDEDGHIKSRYTIDQLKKFLEDAGIKDYNVHEYVEDLTDRVDIIKSGSKKFILNEIKWMKQ